MTDLAQRHAVRQELAARRLPDSWLDPMLLANGYFAQYRSLDPVNQLHFEWHLRFDYERMPAGPWKEGERRAIELIDRANCPA